MTQQNAEIPWQDMLYISSYSLKLSPIEFWQLTINEFFALILRYKQHTSSFFPISTTELQALIQQYPDN
jgi:uncharacterized phage protein (TIGR02216 family)